MFANLSFRVKLLAVVTPPVLVMGGLGWLVVEPGLEAARTAERALRQSELGGAALEVLSALSAEREASALQLAGMTAVGDDGLTADRIRVDEALSAFTDTAAGFDSPDLRRAVSDSLKATGALAGLRDTVDRATVVPVAILAEFTAVADPFARVSGNLAAGATDADLLQLGTALDFFAQGNERSAELRSELAVRLATDSLDGATLGRADALRSEAERRFTQFESRAPLADLESFRSVRARTAWMDSELALDRVIGSGFTPDGASVELEAWLGAMDGRTAALESFQAELAARLRVAAAAKSEAAASSAWWTLILVLAAAGLAVLSAGMVSRSIARRMARISAQAEEIATHRVGEVLDAGRGGDDVTAALPRVEADGRDEVGRLVVAFNTVLGAAVESSLEHARRQQDTVTGLLTSLGRRNQAIIERQLEAIDTLESAQDDPEILAGLFRLDHLATSLRRNAENLLVLASDVAPRGWHAPVPVFDVVRGAASEVEAMERVEVEVDPADPSFIDGRFAVDLSHLLAELIENATRFSPPATAVMVRLAYRPGELVLSVADQGIGMGADELAAANHQIESPVAVGELVADRVGFHVVARLAARLGVRVQLAPGEVRGLVASVAVPFSLLADDPANELDGGPAEPAVGAVPVGSGLDVLAGLDFELDAPALPTPATMPALVAPAPVALTEVPLVAVAREVPTLPVPAVEPFHHPAPPPVSVESPAPPAGPPSPPAPEPVAVESEPEPLPAGLVRRRPGQVLDEARRDEETGRSGFRRLPVPGADEVDRLDGEGEAARRREALERLTTGVHRGRSLFDRDAVQPVDQEVRL